MALSVQFLANANIPRLRANGREYVVVSGVATVPYPDSEFIGPDQALRLMYYGTTAERPARDVSRVNWPPDVMYDTTLSRPVFLRPNTNPAVWVDITGAIV